MTIELQESFPSPELQRSTTPRYDLNHDELGYLTAKFLQEKHDQIPRVGDYACIRVHGSSEYANLGRTVEGIVFTQDLNENPEDMQVEFAPYEDKSWFFVVVDKKQKQPVGNLRVIENGPNGFMALNELVGLPHANDSLLDATFTVDGFFKDYKINPVTTWEVSTIATLPENRRSAHDNNLSLVPLTTEEKAAEATKQHITSGLLYRALYAGAVANGIEHFVAIIDIDAYGKLRNLGIPFYKIFDMLPKEYIDNNTRFQPSVANVSDFGTEMRGYADWKINEAKARLVQMGLSGDAHEAAKNAADRGVQRAMGKRALIEELLTGPKLDHMFAQEHKIS